MLTVNNNFISFSIFEKFPELVCVMSMRGAGDLYIKNLRQPEKVQTFLSQLAIRPDELVSMEQVHCEHVAVVNKEFRGKTIPGVDGLIASERGIYLGVNAGDCVPIFFYDPKTLMTGVIHAGHRSTYLLITAEFIRFAERQGVRVTNLLVAIGPHIGGCCYEVSDHLAHVFKTRFPSEQVVFQTQNKWHVDLGEANKLSLLELGVLPEHIDVPITCTSCQNDRYFSYRKDSKATFGEMLGVIGIRTV
ncbi:TPA: peptidoglycan editing factor PgeF [Patescibacteria group bacterium]|uniref:Purine nucleoside phosphorylase n=1 Tax=Candidatus Gottesmanbacteria bacterium GW2011_GWA1_43_11 TaxID=1618436 RepID=A0A0G1FE99_9BACT|nr:MAG: Multi-copper polyphenol oxidoreductase, laccase [Candidatus Gottesmanbacteria bacterium GW2011_GWA1_43_11]HCS78754.1 peptidoglycan editing factor PgeF [Patescibacteria group bacterium]